MEAFKPGRDTVLPPRDCLPKSGVESRNLGLYDESSFGEACDWVLEHWEVKIGDEAFSMKDSPEFKIAMELFKERAPWRGKFKGLEDDIKLNMIEWITTDGLKYLLPRLIAAQSKIELHLI